MSAEKWVYNFSKEQTCGNGSMRDLLGGKGANLAEMCIIGLPVPPGFTISTAVCNYYYAQNLSLPSNFEEQIRKSIAILEEKLNKGFGNTANPLLVSVRSGARASMPGMMDTILNLGLNDETVQGLINITQNERFAWDSYRRFIQMFSDVVLGVEHYHFEELLEQKKRDASVLLDSELDAQQLKELVAEYKAVVLQHTKTAFPSDVYEQLWMAIKAVINSWMNNRAKVYRKLNDIPENWGTAVNIQAMVFGNLGQTSATGVAFTRNPSTGQNELYGEYLVNAQGEDVVAGIRTPAYITLKAKTESGSVDNAMEEEMPDVYKQFTELANILENHYKDMQDIEFTVENNKLWLLQTRNGKRTAKAAIKIAVDLVKTGKINKEEAIMRISAESLDQLLHPSIDSSAKYKVLDKGLPASPGAASGKVVFSAEDAEDWAKRKEKVILVRIETSPEDISGMHAAIGILTCRGGMTSHAAVVARGMGKCCVTAASNIYVDYKNNLMKIRDQEIKQGDVITLNGSTGEVILGEVPTIEPELSEEFLEVMQWADEIKSLSVRSNAETPLDTKAALKFGAEGIGLCRTEHMFFDPERINVVREMIISETTEARVAALAKLQPMQVNDFAEIFTLMQHRPVNIRFLDPPLHEFLPHKLEEMQEVAKSAGISLDVVARRAAALAESNPMLGHRGCRLGITYPEIYEMQAKAVFIAASKVFKEHKFMPNIEIMIPLVMTPQELEILKSIVIKVAKNIEKEENIHFSYQIGTMIELPRAALCAAEIAKHAEYFSFGTNDLTQTTLGISRDDSSNFIEDYRSQNILEQDPFIRLDEEGVGKLITMACNDGKSFNTKLKTGVCGEHGGNPPSIDFFHRQNIDYVSCSPYRVPIARLAAAQAAIRNK